MRTDCDDCPTTDLCRHPDEPCAKRYDAQRARERAAFDSKVRTHGYVDRVTGKRIHDPDRLAASGVPAVDSVPVPPSPAPVVQVVEQLRALIADDAWACTFQTFGQYRSALLKAIDRMKEPRE